MRYGEWRLLRKPGWQCLFFVAGWLGFALPGFAQQAALPGTYLFVHDSDGSTADKETHPFPTWSPFVKEPGDVYASGRERILERKVVPAKREFEDKATGNRQTVEVPREVTVARDIEMSTPFARFRQSGRQRNGVKVWHEYEYYWYAHQITKPKPPAN